MKNLPKQNILNLKKTAFISLGLILLVIALYLFSSPVKAQETSRTITIIPPSEEQTLNPGARAEGRLKVINDSNLPITFAATVQDYIVEDTKGTPTLLPPNTLEKRFSAAAWIGVTPDIFTVLPGKKQELNYYIQIPQNARPGGHYAAVVYKPVNPVALQGSTAAGVETQIGTLFYISINGPINESAQVSGFLANVFQEYGPVKITTQIKNLGDLHIKPLGTIAISDAFGRKIETLELQKHNIFPTAIREYENTTGKRFMIGRFKADLVASYGRNNNLPLIATVYFWVFPWKLAVLAILVMIAIALGIMYLEKNKPTQQKQEEKAPTQ